MCHGVPTFAYKLLITRHFCFSICIFSTTVCVLVFFFLFGVFLFSAKNVGERCPVKASERNWLRSVVGGVSVGCEAVVRKSERVLSLASPLSWLRDTSRKLKSAVCVKKGRCRIFASIVA